MAGSGILEHLARNGRVLAVDLEYAEFKRIAARAGAILVTNTTSEKLGTSAPSGVMPASRLTHPVVEAGTSPALIEPLQPLGIETHRAAQI